MGPKQSLRFDYSERYRSATTMGWLEYLSTVDAEELDRKVDTNYDSHVKAGIRLMSVVQDDTQHAEQARYVREIIERLGNIGCDCPTTKWPHHNEKFLSAELSTRSTHKVVK